MFVFFFPSVDTVVSPSFSDSTRTCSAQVEPIVSVMFVSNTTHIQSVPTSNQEFQTRHLER